MHGENHTRIERVIPCTSVRFEERIKEQMWINETTVVPPVDPQRVVFLSNLFGQSQKMRGGDSLESLNEIQKLAFRPNYSKLIRYALEHPGSLPTAIKLICTHNQFIRNYVNENFANQVFQNPDYEIFQSLGIPVLKLLLSEIPRNLQYRFPLELPGVQGFPPQHRQLGVKPKLSEKEVSLYMARSKTPEAEIYQMVTKPADPAAGKMELQGKLMEHKKLRKESANALKDPLDKKQVNHLLDQCRSGNLRPGRGTKKIPRIDLYELRAEHGTRVAFKKNNDIIEVWAILNKHNQDAVFKALRELRPE